MNIKTLLLYTALACGTIGTGAAILPFLSHSDESKIAEESAESGNIQRKGPPPRQTNHQGF
jgi:hypothetical protein